MKMGKAERKAGIEPASSVWKTVALPLSYNRRVVALASPSSPGSRGRNRTLIFATKARRLTVRRPESGCLSDFGNGMSGYVHGLFLAHRRYIRK